ncbi:MAG: hypothetical protein KY439_01955 [Actinobacteria bacterium]|nr:hypothetical protein [Actinomycetota bacterium]
MMSQFERASGLREGQERALGRYLRNHVSPHSGMYGEELARRASKATEVLAALPLTRLEDVTDPARLILRPTLESLSRSPERDLRLRWWWARLRRRTGAFNRKVLDPRYKPVHWHSDTIPIGYSAEDLDRLSEIGRCTLEMAGVASDDVLVSLYPPGPSLAFWQLHLGARRAGVPALFLAPDVAADEVARLRPSVLAGSEGDLVRLLEGGHDAGLSFAALHTLIVVGQPLDPARRARLSEIAGGPSGSVAVVAAWAPPGVRALWSECREGIDVHTWPASEVLELVDPLSGTPVPPGADGEVVWTPIGWKGTVVLRLLTGVYGSLEESPCVFCGRTSPRLRVVLSLPPFARVLDEHPQVALWQAELRTHQGAEELIVFLTPDVDGHPGRLLRQLDRQLSVTQFVVLDRQTLRKRLQATGDARVIDSRR